MTCPRTAENRDPFHAVEEDPAPTVRVAGDALGGAISNPVPAGDKDLINVRFTAVFMHRLTPSSKLDEFALAAMLAQGPGKNPRRKGK
jgi:hypothetical protein